MIAATDQMALVSCERVPTTVWSRMLTFSTIVRAFFQVMGQAAYFFFGTVLKTTMDQTSNVTRVADTAWIMREQTIVVVVRILIEILHRAFLAAPRFALFEMFC